MVICLALRTYNSRRGQESGRGVLMMDRLVSLGVVIIFFDSLSLGVASSSLDFWLVSTSLTLELASTFRILRLLSIFSICRPESILWSLRRHNKFLDLRVSMFAPVDGSRGLGSVVVFFHMPGLSNLIVNFEALLRLSQEGFEMESCFGKRGKGNSRVLTLGGCESWGQGR